MTAWELAELVSDDELLAHAEDPDCAWEIGRRSAVSGEPTYNVIDTPIKDEPLDLTYEAESGEPT